MIGRVHKDQRTGLRIPNAEVGFMLTTVTGFSTTEMMALQQ